MIDKRQNRAKGGIHALKIISLYHSSAKSQHHSILNFRDFDVHSSSSIRESNRRHVSSVLMPITTLKHSLMKVTH